MKGENMTGSVVRRAIDAPTQDLIILADVTCEKKASGTRIDEGKVLWKPHYGHRISVSVEIRICSDGKERVFTSANCSCGKRWSNDGGEVAMPSGDDEIRRLAIYGDWWS